MSMIERGNLLFINTQGTGMCFEKIEGKWQALGWDGDPSDLLNSYRLLLIALVEDSKYTLDKVALIRQFMHHVLDEEDIGRYREIIDYCEKKNSSLITQAQDTILQVLDFMAEIGVPVHDFTYGAANEQEKAQQDFNELVSRLQKKEGKN